jgi:hypothetical protein
VLLLSLVRAVQDGNGGSDTKRRSGSRTVGQEKGAGEALLEVVRRLAEMAPNERAALIELVKALGWSDAAE